MVFYSIAFITFFSIFFVLYWGLSGGNLKVQNLLLLTGSYFFYGWWDWRFLILLAAYSGVNFWLGQLIYKARDPKMKQYLSFAATLIGIGLLSYFKYANFFIASLTNGLAHLHIIVNFKLIRLALPLGISFFTFRTLSYIYDIKNGKLKPTTDWIVFFSFVAFFPAILAGPIDKAKTFIPQLETKRTFGYASAVDGLRQILWGLFKKTVIAGNLEIVTQRVFSDYQHTGPLGLIVGAWYYSIQLYADFSGYSDMAIGFSRLLGFEVAQNFNFPFFSQNVAEYWRKWHMSLTSWFTDYVFTPLSFSLRRMKKWGLVAAIVVNFLLVGIWHGANWTFVVFGLMNGLYFIPVTLKGRKKNAKKVVGETRFAPLKSWANIVQTFLLISFSHIFFRSDSISAAFGYIRCIFLPAAGVSTFGFRTRYIPFIAAFFLFEWLQRDKKYALDISGLNNLPVRRCIYYLLLLAMVLLGAPQVTEFIYLKF